MKNNIKNTTLLAFIAGAIAIPVIYYVLRRRTVPLNNTEEGYAPDSQAKKIFSAYRGEHKPHHRKPNHNGHLN
jgi:hypothetical protein